MDKAGQQALSRTIFALDEDRNSGIGDFIDLLPGHLHGLRAAENQIGRRKISCPVTGNCFGDCCGCHMVLVWITPGSEILPLVYQMHTMSQTILPPVFRIALFLYRPGINNPLFINYLLGVR
jgi:hypothetical protein